MMTDRARVRLLALVVGFGIIGWTYADSLRSIVGKWLDDTAFSHGLLIAPISLWLAWRLRHAVTAVRWHSSWSGVASLALAVSAWIVARGTGVLVVEQLAVVTMVPAMVLAVLGPAATRVLAVPLGFLVFAVPMGRALVPWLQQVTADISTWALQVTGVPIYRTNVFIQIPSGSFEVAQACSGLNYSIAGLALGVLYSYLTYRRPWKRLLSVAAFIVVPVLANGLRVYFTILVSHLTEMEYGPGKEHVEFGRVFFIVIMFVMFWIGRRWADDPALPGPVVPRMGLAGEERVPLPARGTLGWLVAALAVVLPLAGPPYLAASLERAAVRLDAVDTLVAFPVAGSGWSFSPEPGWRPEFRGAVVERQGVYRHDQGSRVDVFVGVYGLGATGGAEMIRFGNRIADDERRGLVTRHRRTVALDEGSLTVVERPAGPKTDEYLVWYWYQVGARPAYGGFVVKALEALSFATRAASDARIVTLATPLDDDASERLEAFARVHGRCVRAGFTAEACTE
jgi:exosortase A